MFAEPLFYMKLNQFTDIGLRTLAYLTRGVPATITEISLQLNISRHHLTKVVHFMGKQQWIITTQGKNGGIRLAHHANTYKLGDTIQTLEQFVEKKQPLIDCIGLNCKLIPACKLTSFLDQALVEFYRKLNEFTLADMLKNQELKKIFITTIE